MRGASAARVEVTDYEDDENSALFWMSEKDIKNNIRDFGPSKELDLALAAYKHKAADNSEMDAWIDEQRKS